MELLMIVQAMRGIFHIQRKKEFTYIIRAYLRIIMQ